MVFFLSAKISLTTVMAMNAYLQPEIFRALDSGRLVFGMLGAIYHRSLV